MIVGAGRTTEAALQGSFIRRLTICFRRLNLEASKIKKHGERWGYVDGLYFYFHIY